MGWWLNEHSFGGEPKLSYWYKPATSSSSGFSSGISDGSIFSAETPPITPTLWMLSFKTAVEVIPAPCGDNTNRSRNVSSSPTMNAGSIASYEFV